MMWDIHPGERRIQQLAGTERGAGRAAAMVEDVVPVRARPFLAAQPMVLAASADGEGRPTASVLLGRPGFARSDTGEHVVLDGVPRAPWDPLWANLAPGGELGLLAIDLLEARRLRVNGRIEGLDPVLVRVAEGYPNCPKYIQQRRLISLAERDTRGDAADSGVALDEPRQALIRAADTLFVASRHPERGLDVSHRGGRAGFVEVVDPLTLRIPDYAGNGMYMTLGNLVVDDRAGLLFLDFAQGRALQVSGRTELRFERRCWELRVERWTEGPLAVDARWEYLGPSRFNPEPEPACPTP